MAEVPISISQHDWDRQKDNFIDLYHRRKLPLQSKNGGPSVIQTMRDEHNFCASLSQYEAQIRRWDMPKNLKRSEWVHIVAKMDDLRSGGVESRLKLAGSLVSADKIKQKRRRYSRAMPTPLNAAESPSGRFLWDSPRFTLEILAPNGQWLPYREEEAPGHAPRHATLSSSTIDTTSRTVTVRSMPSNNSTMHHLGQLSNDKDAIRRPVPMISSDDTLPHPWSRDNGADAESHCHTEHITTVLDPSQDTLTGTYEETDSPSLPDYRFHGIFNVSGMDKGFTLFPSSQELLLPIADAARLPSSPPGESLTWSSIEGNVDASIFKLLEDSPFFLLEKQFRALSITSTGQGEQSYMMESYHSSISLHSELTERHRGQYSISVFRGIASIPTNAQMIAAFLGQEQLIQNHQFKTFEDSLGSLLPENTPDLSGYTGVIDESLLAANRLLNSPFHRAILYSIINNFAGLPRTPAFPLLQNYSSFFGLTKSCPSFAVRSFIDNAFSTAVWSLNAQAVDFLVKMTYGTPYPVDVHKIIVSKGQTPARPIEVALRYTKSSPKDLLRYSKDALETAEVLLKAGADPRQALCGFKRGSPCPNPDMLEFIRQLLYRGAEPNADTLSWIVSHGDEALVELLLARIPRASYQIYFDVPNIWVLPFLAQTALHLSNITATRIIKSVLCEWPRSKIEKHCPGTYESTMGYTLLCACSKGNRELVEFLLPLVSQVSSAALAAAIRSCEQPLIELLLETGANVSEVPVNLIHARFGAAGYMCECTGRDTVIIRLIGDISIPLAEAIRSRNLSLIEKLEYTLTRTNNKGIEQALEAAADVGDLDLSRKILHTTAGMIDGSVRRPLCLAIQRNHNDIALLLLDAGVEINRSLDNPHDPYKDTPLLSAIRARQTKLIEAILEHDPILSDPAYIRMAALLGDVDTIKALLSSQATVSLKALSTALKSGNYDMFNVLLDHFWRHNLEFQEWNLPSYLRQEHPWDDDELMDIVFSTACTKNDTLLISLLEHGIPVGRRAIEAAMWKKDSAIIELLMTHEMRPKVTLDTVIILKDHTMLRQYLSKGFSFLREGAFLHAMRFDKEAFGILMEAFRDRYPQGLQGWGGILLKYAIRKSDSPRLKELLDAQMDIKSFGRFHTTRDSYEAKRHGPKSTPLGFAIYSKKGKNLGDVQTLLDAGSEPNGIAGNAGNDSIGWRTPLLLAIGTGDLELIEVILRGGADVNLAARHGRKRTPLQRACELCNIPVVKLLLSWQADVNGEPAIRAGGTALQLAAIGGSIKIAKLLLDNGADIHAHPAKVHGRTPFEGAAEHGRLDMLKFIWDATFPEGISDEEARRAIHFSQKNGHRVCEQYIKYLVPSADISKTSGNLGPQQFVDSRPQNYLPVHPPSDIFRGSIGDESDGEPEEDTVSDAEETSSEEESDWEDELL